jgi:predicted secreted protein
VFFNRYQDKQTHKVTFNIRVHKAEKQNGNGLVKVWKPVGEMDVGTEDFALLTKFLVELKAES